MPWSPSCPTTPGASTAPSGASSPAGATKWGCSRCRRTHSPWPATWRCAPADGASVATLRLTASAIAKAHEWAGHESPCRDQGVRASLKGWGRRLARPQRQAGALTADVLAVIRLTAVQPRKRGRGFETAEQTAERVRFDMALVAALSDGGLRRSEASALAWGDCSAGTTAAAGITVARSKTDVEAAGAVVAITPPPMRALDLPRRLRKLDNFGFLLLDDLGYLPQGTEESEVLFTLIAER